MHAVRNLPSAMMKRQQQQRTMKTPTKTNKSTTTTTTIASTSFQPSTPQSKTQRTLNPQTKKPKRGCLTPTIISSSQETLVGDHWKPLNLGRSELFLPLTFPTGQTFRWKQTGPHQYTGVVESYLVSLKQHLDDDDDINGFGDVSYYVHHHHLHCTDDAKAVDDALADYLNMGISLKEMWETFSESDSRFSELAVHLGGARVLRQDPFECLIQFLCSSNNNIGRITKMVDFISSLGDYLGTVEGFKFYKFPSLERLSLVSEEEFRAAGFGYRAKYIVGTVNALRLKPNGGAEWLASLREVDLDEAVEALSSLPGVGPKVAACIALFSLDQHHAVPVDTHVWKIATRYLIPELAGARLTPKLCSRVAEAFVMKYGKYAGWAQTLLFIAELPSQRAILPSHLGVMAKNVASFPSKADS